MSTQPAARMTLSQVVRAEIRAEMGRQMLSQKDLAARVGEGQPWVSRRLFGATPISIDDLERIAAALGRTDPRSFMLPRLDSNQQPAGYGQVLRFRTDPLNVAISRTYPRQNGVSPCRLAG